jgi:photosystem II stability/assembly factor-like uncharacterized protein
VTVDPLEVLRAHNPVPDGSAAPPIELVLSRLGHEAARPYPRRRRWSLVPALAVAATVAVVTAIVVLAVRHRGPAPANVPPATRTAPTVRSFPPPQSLMPRGGMRGSVSIDGVVSASGGRVLISFEQCQPCGTPGAGSGTLTHHLWRAATTDGGASWHLARASADLSLYDLSGPDGWAEGVGTDRVARFYASHDGGRTWHVASSAAFAPGGVGDVSIAGGEVWSLGCTGTHGCTDTMLRAPASADHLASTERQPPLGDTTNVSVVGASRDDAYVLTDDYGMVGNVATVVRTRLFATHDGGRTWRRLAAACPARTFGRLYAGGADALWAVCAPMHGGTELRRSADGGAHWTTLPSPPGSLELQPASAQAAWALTPGGRVVRTGDGGQTWSRVWYGGQTEPGAPPDIPPGLARSWRAFLSVQSSTTATVVVQVTRGRGRATRTDFITYRTTDGGRTWRPRVLRLPSG